MTGYCYSAFDLVFRSSLALPFAPAPSRRPDVVVRTGEVPAALPAPVADHETWQAKPGLFLMRVPGLADVLVQQGREIVIAPGPASEAAIASLVAGPVAAALLQQRHLTTLRAGAAVLRGGGAALFLCGSALGKSSLIAALAARGYTMLADDLTALHWRRGALVALPAFPALRLWSDALARLGWEHRPRRPLCEDETKHLVPLPEAFHPVPAPVRRCYILVDGPRRETVLTPIARRDAIHVLLAHRYRQFFEVSAASRFASFRTILALAQRVPMLQAERSLDGFPLECLADVVARDLARSTAERRSRCQSDCDDG